VNVTVWKNIGVLRGIAILLVVLNHAVLYVRAVRLEAPLGEVPWGPLEAAVLLVGVTVPVASVAAFMIASGYFLGRFSTTWPAALSSARALGLRWAIWSAAGFAFLLVTSSSFTLDQVLPRLLTGYGPFPAYWYLAVMMLVLLVSPFLSDLASRRPWTLLAVVIGLEAARAIGYYGRLNDTDHVLPLETSYFLLGVLLSRHTDAVVGAIARHRRAIAVGALLLLASAIVETACWWSVTGGPGGRVISADRLSVRLYSVAATAWFMLGESRRAGWKSRLDSVGARSLAILLMADFFQQFTLRVAWHLPAGAGAAAGPPAWLGSPWFVLPYFGVGVAGPLLAYWASERVAGRRWRQLLLG
jgi:surface polysaccharide O-acyltransferase-like enzyme